MNPYIAKWPVYTPALQGSNSKTPTLYKGATWPRITSMAAESPEHCLRVYPFLTLPPKKTPTKYKVSVHYRESFFQLLS